MATSHQEKNICCGCLDFCPKINMLSCSHSLCADCCGPTCPGSAWVSCPVCRTLMPVAESGVSPTEANPLTPNRSKTSSSDMIRPSSSKEDPGMPCSHHQGQNLCAVCEECDAIVCKICRQEKHTDHKIKCLEEADVASKKEYLDNVARLSVCEQHLHCALDRVLQTEQAVRERQAALEAQIRARKDILEQWIHEASVQALVTLEIDSKKFIATLCGDRFVLTRKNQYLEKARKNAVTLLVADASDDTDLKNRKGDKKERDIKDKLHRLMSNLPHLNENLPVLRFHDLAISNAAVSEFIGTVAMTPFVPTLHDSLVSFRLAFRITEDSETEIHAVCPTKKNSVWVSCGFPGREVVSLYKEDGKLETSICVECVVKVARMTEHWVLAEGRGRTWFFSPHSALQWRYGGPAKLCRFYGKQNSGFYLCVHQNRLCDLRSLTIEGGSSASDQPVITGTKICDLMFHSLPVSMDVSAHGKILAVLAEDNDHVLLFNISDPSPNEPYLTFIPPGSSSSSFKPHDLCFFSGFTGQECLVIADWLNDVLVLLHVTEESCVLIGYLGAGCPLMVKPTALAADECGRLWIGCSEGQLVVMEQKDTMM